MSHLPRRIGFTFSIFCAFTAGLLGSPSARADMSVTIGAGGLAAGAQMEGQMAGLLFEYAKTVPANCPGLFLTSHEDINGLGLPYHRYVTLSYPDSSSGTTQAESKPVVSCEYWWGSGMGGIGNGASCTYNLDFRMKLGMASPACSDPARVLFEMIAKSRHQNPQQAVKVQLKATEDSVTCTHDAQHVYRCEFMFKNTGSPPQG